MSDNNQTIHEQWRDSVRSGQLTHLLLALTVFIIWFVYLTYYNARILGLLLTIILRRLVKSYQLKIGSVSISVLGGKIMFRDVHIVCSDYAIRCHDIYIILNYWQNYSGDIFSTQQERALLINAFGLECHLYNRTQLYDELFRLFDFKANYPGQIVPNEVKPRANSTAQDTVKGTNKTRDSTRSSKSETRRQRIRKWIPLGRRGSDVSDDEPSNIGTNNFTDQSNSAAGGVDKGIWNWRDLFSQVKFEVELLKICFGNTKLPYAGCVQCESANILYKTKQPNSSWDLYQHNVICHYRNFTLNLAETQRYNGTFPKEELPRNMGSGFQVIRWGRGSFTYIQDVPGLASFQPERVQMTEGNVSTEKVWPLWKMEMRVTDGSQINYGPWADRQRELLWKFFFPPDYEELEITPESKPGEPRKYNAFDFKLIMETNTQVEIMFTKGKDRQIVVMEIGKGSDVGLHLPWMTDNNGFCSVIKGNLLNVDVTATHLVRQIFYSENLTFQINCNYARCWNAHQSWDYLINVHHARVNFVFDHKHFFNALINEWSSRHQPDFLYFIPFVYRVAVEGTMIELTTYANDFNWIATNSENARLGVCANEMSIKFDLPFEDFLPQKVPIHFCVETHGVTGRLFLPFDSTSVPLMQELESHKIITDRQGNIATDQQIFETHRQNFLERIKDNVTIDAKTITDEARLDALMKQWFGFAVGPYARLRVTYTYFPMPLCHNMWRFLPLHLRDSQVEFLPETETGAHKYSYDYASMPKIGPTVEFLRATGFNPGYLESDFIDVQIEVPSVTVMAYGAFIRHLLHIKENVFGCDQTPVDCSLGPIEAENAIVELPENEVLDPRYFRPFALHLKVAVHDLQGHIPMHCSRGVSSCPTALLQCFAFEMDKCYEETKLQLVLSPIVLAVYDHCQDRHPGAHPLSEGNLVLQGLQVRGHALFSSIDLPLTSESSEYGWLLEITIGQLSGQLTSLQVTALVECVQALVLLVTDTENEVRQSKNYKMCQHGYPQTLCPMWSPQVSAKCLCPNEEDLKYKLLRVSVDGLHLYFVEAGAALQLSADPLRLSNCNLHGPGNKEGISAILPRVKLQQWIHPIRTPENGPAPWLEAGSLAVGPISISAGIALPLLEFRAWQDQFLRRHDRATHRLWFLWPMEECPRDIHVISSCGCVGGCVFFGKNEEAQEFLTICSSQQRQTENVMEQECRQRLQHTLPNLTHTFSCRVRFPLVEDRGVGDTLKFGESLLEKGKLIYELHDSNVCNIMKSAYFLMHHSTVWPALQPFDDNQPGEHLVHSLSRTPLILDDEESVRSDSHPQQHHHQQQQQQPHHILHQQQRRASYTPAPPQPPPPIQLPASTSSPVDSELSPNDPNIDSINVTTTTIPKAISLESLFASSSSTSSCDDKINSKSNTEQGSLIGDDKDLSSSGTPTNSGGSHLINTDPTASDEEDACYVDLRYQLRSTITESLLLRKAYERHLTRSQCDNWCQRHLRLIDYWSRCHLWRFPHFTVTQEGFSPRMMTFKTNLPNLSQQQQQQPIKSFPEDKFFSESSSTIEPPGNQSQDTCTRSTIILHLKGSVDVLLTPLFLESAQRYLEVLIPEFTHKHPSIIVDSLHNECITSTKKSRKAYLAHLSKKDKNEGNKDDNDPTTITITSPTTPAPRMSTKNRIYESKRTSGLNSPYSATVGGGGGGPSLDIRDIPHSPSLKFTPGQNMTKFFPSPLQSPEPSSRRFASSFASPNSNFDSHNSSSSALLSSTQNVIRKISTHVRRPSLEMNPYRQSVIHFGPQSATCDDSLERPLSLKRKTNSSASATSKNMLESYGDAVQVRCTQLSVSVERLNVCFIQLYTVEDRVRVETVQQGLYDLTCVSLLAFSLDSASFKVMMYDKRESICDVPNDKKLDKYQSLASDAEKRRRASSNPLKFTVTGESGGVGVAPSASSPISTLQMEEGFANSSSKEIDSSNQQTATAANVEDDNGDDDDAPSDEECDPLFSNPDLPSPGGMMMMDDKLTAPPHMNDYRCTEEIVATLTIHRIHGQLRRLTRLSQFSPDILLTAIPFAHSKVFFGFESDPKSTYGGGGGVGGSGGSGGGDDTGASKLDERSAGWIMFECGLEQFQLTCMQRKGFRESMEEFDKIDVKIGETKVSQVDETGETSLPRHRETGKIDEENEEEEDEEGHGGGGGGEKLETVRERKSTSSDKFKSQAALLPVQKKRDSMLAKLNVSTVWLNFPAPKRLPYKRRVDITRHDWNLLSAATPTIKAWMNPSEGLIHTSKQLKDVTDRRKLAVMACLMCQIMDKESQPAAPTVRKKRNKPGAHRSAAVVANSVNSKLENQIAELSLLIRCEPTCLLFTIFRRHMGESEGYIVEMERCLREDTLPSMVTLQRGILVLTRDFRDYKDIVTYLMKVGEKLPQRGDASSRNDSNAAASLLSWSGQIPTTTNGNVPHKYVSSTFLNSDADYSSADDYQNADEDAALMGNYGGTLRGIPQLQPIVEEERGSNLGLVNEDALNSGAETDEYSMMQRFLLDAKARSPGSSAPMPNQVEEGNLPMEQTLYSWCAQKRIQDETLQEIPTNRKSESLSRQMSSSIPGLGEHQNLALVNRAAFERAQHQYIAKAHNYFSPLLRVLGLHAKGIRRTTLMNKFGGFLSADGLLDHFRIDIIQSENNPLKQLSVPLKNGDPNLNPTGSSSGTPPQQSAFHCRKFSLKISLKDILAVNKALPDQTGAIEIRPTTTQAHIVLHVESMRQHVNMALLRLVHQFVTMIYCANDTREDLERRRQLSNRQLYVTGGGNSSGSDGGRGPSTDKSDFVPSHRKQDSKDSSNSTNASHGSHKSYATGPTSGGGVSDALSVGQPIVTTTTNSSSSGTNTGTVASAPATYGNDSLTLPTGSSPPVSSSTTAEVMMRQHMKQQVPNPIRCWSVLNEMLNFYNTVPEPKTIDKPTPVNPLASIDEEDGGSIANDDRNRMSFRQSARRSRLPVLLHHERPSHLQSRPSQSVTVKQFTHQWVYAERTPFIVFATAHVKEMRLTAVLSEMKLDATVTNVMGSFTYKSLVSGRGRFTNRSSRHSLSAHCSETQLTLSEKLATSKQDVVIVAIGQSHCLLSGNVSRRVKNKEALSVCIGLITARIPHHPVKLHDVMQRNAKKISDTVFELLRPVPMGPGQSRSRSSDMDKATAVATGGIVKDTVDFPLHPDNVSSKSPRSPTSANQLQQDKISDRKIEKLKSDGALRVSGISNGIIISVALHPSLDAIYKIEPLYLLGSVGATMTLDINMPQHSLSFNSNSILQLPELPRAVTIRLPAIITSVNSRSVANLTHFVSGQNVPGFRQLTKDLMLQSGTYIDVTASISMLDTCLTSDLLNYIVVVVRLFMKEINEIIQKMAGEEQVSYVVSESVGKSMDSARLLNRAARGNTKFNVKVSMKGIRLMATAETAAVRLETKAIDVEFSNRVLTSATVKAMEEEKMKEMGKRKRHKHKRRSSTRRQSSTGKDGITEDGGQLLTEIGNTDALFVLAKITSISMELGQLDRDVLYKERAPDFKMLAFFKTTVGLRSVLPGEMIPNAASQQDAFLISLMRPIIWVSPTSFDRGIILWMSYKNEFEKWSKQMETIAIETETPSMSRFSVVSKPQNRTSRFERPSFDFLTTTATTDLRRSMAVTNELTSATAPTPTATTAPTPAAAPPPSAVNRSILILQLSVEDFGICMPVSGPKNRPLEMDTRSVVIFTLKSSALSVCYRGSLAAEGDFTNCCLRFDDDFNLGSDDWNPDMECNSVKNRDNQTIPVILNACYVPNGNFRVCSKTHNSQQMGNPKMVLNVGWQMCGLNVHLDTRVGHLLRNMFLTLTTLTGQDESDDDGLNDVTMPEMRMGRVHTLGDLTEDLCSQDMEVNSIHSGPTAIIHDISPHKVEIEMERARQREASVCKTYKRTKWKNLFRKSSMPPTVPTSATTPGGMGGGGGVGGSVLSHPSSTSPSHHAPSEGSNNQAALASPRASITKPTELSFDSQISNKDARSNTSVPPPDSASSSHTGSQYWCDTRSVLQGQTGSETNSQSGTPASPNSPVPFPVARNVSVYYDAPPESSELEAYANRMESIQSNQKRVTTYWQSIEGPEDYTFTSPRDSTVSSGDEYEEAMSELSDDTTLPATTTTTKGILLRRPPDVVVVGTLKPTTTTTATASLSNWDRTSGTSHLEPTGPILDLELDVSIHVDCGTCVLHPLINQKSNKKFDERERTLTAQRVLTEPLSLIGLDTTTAILERFKNHINNSPRSVDLTTFYLPEVNVKWHYNSKSEGDNNNVSNTSADHTGNPLTPRNRKKKADLYAYCSIQSLKDLVIHPSLLDFLEQSLENVPMISTQQTNKDATVKSDSYDAEDILQVAKVETFPVDVIVHIHVKPSTVKFTCLPSYQEQCLVSVPYLDLVFTTKRNCVELHSQDEDDLPKPMSSTPPPSFTFSSQQYRSTDKLQTWNSFTSKLPQGELFSEGGLCVSGILKEFEVRIFHPYGITKSDTLGASSTSHETADDALCFSLKDITINIFRTRVTTSHRINNSFTLDHLQSQSVGDTLPFNATAAARTATSPENSLKLNNNVKFSAVCNIGGAYFKCDTRRVTEILAIPSAWYRKRLARRVFLGDEASQEELDLRIVSRSSSDSFHDADQGSVSADLSSSLPSLTKLSKSQAARQTKSLKPTKNLPNSPPSLTKPQPLSNLLFNPVVDNPSTTNKATSSSQQQAVAAAAADNNNVLGGANKNNTTSSIKVSSWQTLLLITTTLKQADLDMFMGTAMGTTKLTLEGLYGQGRLLMDSGHKKKYSIGAGLRKCALHAERGVVGGEICVKDIDSKVHILEDPGLEPEHLLEANLGGLQCHLEYMGTMFLLGRLSGVELRLRDEWHVVSNVTHSDHVTGDANHPQLHTKPHPITTDSSETIDTSVMGVEINGDLKWNQFQMAISRSTTPDLQNSFRKLIQYFTEQVKEGKRSLLAQDWLNSSSAGFSRGPLGQQMPDKDGVELRQLMERDELIDRVYQFHWQKAIISILSSHLGIPPSDVLSLLKGPQLTSSLFAQHPLCAGGSLQLFGNSLGVACFAGKNFRLATDWAVFTMQYPELSFDTKARCNLELSSPLPTESNQNSLFSKTTDFSSPRSPAAAPCNSDSVLISQELSFNLGIQQGRRPQMAYVIRVRRGSAKNNYLTFASISKWFDYAFQGADVAVIGFLKSKFPQALTDTAMLCNFPDIFPAPELNKVNSSALLTKASRSGAGIGSSGGNSSAAISTIESQLTPKPPTEGQLLFAIPAASVSLYAEHKQPILRPAFDEAIVFAESSGEGGGESSTTTAEDGVEGTTEPPSSGSTDQTANVDKDEIKAGPVVKLSFNSDFHDNLYLGPDIVWLPQLIQSYIKDTSEDIDSFNSSVASVLTQKASTGSPIVKDLRQFIVEKWVLSPSCRWIPALNLQVPAFDKVLEMVGFHRARSTIPKWLQRGVMDNLDLILATMVQRVVVLMDENGLIVARPYAPPSPLTLHIPDQHPLYKFNDRNKRNDGQRDREQF